MTADDRGTWKSLYPPPPGFPAGIALFVALHALRGFAKAVFGIGFTTTLTVALGGPIAMGLAIGCGLAFVAIAAAEAKERNDGNQQA